MTGQAVIGSTDISNFIIEDSYEMDSIQSFESWLDGNKLQHRSGIVEKIKGKFNVVCAPHNNFTLTQLNTIFSDATTNGVTYAGFYVTNKGQFKAIDCYYSIKNVGHTLTSSGFIDVVTVEIQER